MRKIPVLLFVLALVAAACAETSDDGAGAATPAAPATTVASGEAHVEGDAPVADPDEAAHEEGDGHDEDADAPEGEAHEEGDDHDADEDHEEGMDMGEEFIPEAVGEVTSEYTIMLHEFAFESFPAALTPGETVRFTLINEGAIEHEFRLTTAHKAEEHIAGGHEGHGEAQEDPDILVLVQPGETRVVEMTLPADAGAIDQVACLIPGHHEAGMFTDFQF